MMDALAITFAVVTVVCFLGSLYLLAVAVRTALPTSSAEERRFKAFKHVRIGTYAFLVAVQAALIVGRQWEHPLTVSAVDVDGLCVWALYLVTLVVLVRRQSAQLGIRMSATLLLTMLQVRWGGGRAQRLRAWRRMKGALHTHTWVAVTRCIAAFCLRLQRCRLRLRRSPTPCNRTLHI